MKIKFISLIISKFSMYAITQSRLIKTIGMIVSANILGTALGMVGTLVQARFISPNDLGFLRKYSVVSGYAVFLSLGFFAILVREYPVLMGRGDQEKARRVAAIGQTWCLTASLVVSLCLFVVCLIQLCQGNWRESCAWFIQIVSVWTILYGGYLTCTFRSGHEFERLAKSNFYASILSVFVLPLFVLWPFPALVLRSIIGPIFTSIYLHVVRPVRVGWCLPLTDFIDLVKRGSRLFVGSYMRYHFWMTLEIWLMLVFAGEVGVGLFVFSLSIVSVMEQFAAAINQVYMPRLAQYYGQSGSLGGCLRLAAKPTIFNVVLAVLVFGISWGLLPPLLIFMFPKYASAVPMLKLLLLDIVIVSLSLPMHMVLVLEDYATRFIAAIIGLAVFVIIAFTFQSCGFMGMSVILGTLLGRFFFEVVSFISIVIRFKRNRYVKASAFN